MHVAASVFVLASITTLNSLHFDSCLHKDPHTSSRDRLWDGLASFHAQQQLRGRYKIVQQYTQIANDLPASFIYLSYCFNRMLLSQLV
jgi:hypothetical protein